ncbi:unannotated protein [freshwater metagenome]|uniref:Unannotated protein n=1 Tax=freshwater metagenome TaxID=449393 RepID=A0A6J7ECE7_9ZZZZ|nr:hypothetical protein [Actinomycetota bacterium]
MSTFDVTNIKLYEDLASHMNHQSEHFRILGDADMTMVFAVQTPDKTLHFQLVFSELRCDAVDLVPADEAHMADFSLVGSVESWSDMFDDIYANGGASGPWTINSLALRGDRISCEGNDPMGLDKFSRFNQTLQDFLDGAGRLDLIRSQP